MTCSKSRIMVRVLGTVSLMAILLSLGAGAIAAPPGQGGGLFEDVSVEGYGDPADDPKIVRTRLVEPNFALLGGTDDAPAADALELNLFSDVAFTAVLDRAESNPSGSLSWMGRLEGVEYGSVILVVKDGVMVGSVKMPGAFYQIRYVGGGVHAIHEMDEAAFPIELEPIPVTTSEDALVEAPSAPTADDGSIIDVLVVYTDDARVDVGDTAAMEALIDQAIAETNTSYANSNITQRVNLVHTAEVSYDESGFDWSTTLIRLRTHGDGYFDNVTQSGTGLRDTYCADEVVLLVEDDEYCGLAYLMDSVSSIFESHAFALVCWDCATGYYSFGHEMGHNMGARHDWYVDEDITPYTYAHGYVNAPDRWRTIMAYNTECFDQGFNCDRLQYWSNPNVLYGGDPMGVPAGTSTSCSTGVPNPNCDADNHLTLNNTAYTVANFRDSAACGKDISGYVRDSSGTGISGVTVDFGGARPSVTTNSSGYYSQSDFSDGDYTVSFGRPGYFFSPVEDQVTVSGANATHDATGYPIVPASVPFYDGFESGDLGSAWAVETDYEGRVRVDTYDPHWGSYSLLLDDDTNGSFYSHASAILALDLSGQSQVDLSFWWRAFGDEDHTDDGVFISDDYGATWYQAFPFTGAVTAYTQTPVDLDAAASAAGMVLNDHFLVKFQFYDDYPIGSDGYGIDDVSVTAGGAAAGPLVYVSHTVDDDTDGESSGNDDGVVNCGESIELYVDLYNQGINTTTGVSATISTTDPYITFIDNTASAYPDIAGLGTGTNGDDFDFDVAPETPPGHAIQFSLDIAATNGGPWSASFDVPISCGPSVYLPLVMKRYPPVPYTPVLDPINNPDGDGNYTVSWDAAELADTYTLEEDDNASFSSPTTRYNGSSTLWNASGKPNGTYYYHVRANNSWGSSGWSNVRSVTVRPPSGPKPGFWESTYEEFYVTSNGAYVDDFATYIYVSGCGSYKITHTPQEPISNNHFSFTGSFYANGTFSDATHCSGQDGLSYFYISGCGYVSGGPWSYNATWQHASAMRRFHAAERVSTEAVGTPDPASRVEKIDD